MMGWKNKARRSKVRRQTGSHSDRTQCESNEDHLGDLTCSICLEIFVEPMQCKQGHVFCKACIEKTLEEKEECPMDRSKLQVADLGRALVVETIMDRMRVHCPHADGSKHCDWVGKVSERQAHTNDECGHTLVPCPHDGCEVSVQRRVVSEHAASCEQRVEACERCSAGIVVAHRAQHEEECPMKRVACPLDGCGALNRRKETAEHEAVCPMMQVECAFEVCGCTVGTLLRKDVAAHERDAAAAHAALALQESKSQAKETANLKHETVSMKQVIDTLQAQLERSAQAATGPVSVRWRVEDVEAKIASGGNFFSKEILLRSATRPLTPLRFKVRITFKEGTGDVGLTIESYCDNPTYLAGTSLTLCKADSENGLERTFPAGAYVQPGGRRGWNAFATCAKVRESHVAADGSITILATLVARQVLDV